MKASLSVLELALIVGLFDFVGVATESSSALPLGVAKEARVSDMELQDDRLGDEEWNLVNVER